ncbi:MAG: aminotransferase class V-fold PLP-dependent enzyme, partial [Rhodococcus sp. (in: high G+C Gram-positive bacteria)]
MSLTTTQFTDLRSEPPYAVLDRLADWQRDLRADFPIITAHPSLTYLDSSATAQKPRPVLDAVLSYLVTTNANAGRGTYGWANSTTELVEAGRAAVHEFLGDRSTGSSSVVFLDGA